MLAGAVSEDTLARGAGRAPPPALLALCEAFQAEIGSLQEARDRARARLQETPPPRVAQRSITRKRKPQRNSGALPAAAKRRGRL